MLILVVFVLVLFELNVETNESANTDTSEVAVESLWEVVEVESSFADFSADGHLVWITTCVEWDSSDYHISSDESGNNNDNDFLNLESEVSQNDSAPDDYTILGVGIINHECSYKEEAKSNTSPSCKASDTDGSVCLNGKSSKKSDDSATNNDDPLDCCRSFFVKMLKAPESQVYNSTKSDYCSSNEQNDVDQSISSEAEN